MRALTDTRARLLKVALELIWRSSYHATGVDLICATAKVKKGSFYHFFASKEELAIAALDAQWAEFKPGFDTVFAGDVPPLERLVRFLRHGIDEQKRLHGETGFVCGCPLFTLGAEIGTQQPKLRAKVDELLQEHHGYVERAIRDAHATGAIHAPDAARKARMLTDYFEGVLTRARIMNSLAPLEEGEEAMFEILGATRQVRAVPDLPT